MSTPTPTAMYHSAYPPEHFNPSTTRDMPMGPAPAAGGDDKDRGVPASDTDDRDGGVTISDVPDFPRPSTTLAGSTVPIHHGVVAGVVLTGAVD